MEKLKSIIRSIFGVAIIVGFLLLGLIGPSSGAPSLGIIIEALLLGAIIMAAICFVLLLFVHFWNAVLDEDSSKRIGSWVYWVIIAIAFGFTCCILVDIGILD